MINSYPKQGDIIWLNLEPRAGKEPTKRRPFLALSNSKYNQKVGLIIGCPITSVKKGYPFEVELPNSAKTQGVVLSDHVKSLDFTAREFEFIEHLNSNLILNNVLSNIKLLIDI